MANALNTADTAPPAPALRLHDFFNSSAAYRVRIALNLKGLTWEHVGVKLRSGEQNQPGYKALNPAGLVPMLEAGGAHVKQHVTQSLAIIDHLDRLQPAPLLVPAGGPTRDRVLEIAQLIACDIHPLNNLRVLKYLVGPLALTEAQKNAWVAHWIGLGFDALEAMLQSDGSAGDGDWCVGTAPTLADCCLVPQVANARRAGIDVARWPRMYRLDALACQHPAFEAAAPLRQPDFIAA